MRPASDISGQQTLPGEILPTDKTVVADGRPRPQVPLPVGPFRVGRFTAVRQIGAGGMGVVYMAYDEQLDRKVAVKLLQERPGADAESLGHARLLREAQAMAHVSHPNVAAVYEVGTYEDQVFVAMELVEGKTLGQWLADEPRSWQEIVAVYVQAGRGLAAAHAAGLVHRDFKPENVIVGDDGRARVLDFGLARASRDVPTLPPAEISGTDLRLNTSLAVQLTQAGSLLGTPAYMPPEQYLRAGIDARSDQFSFCVALFEALYGARPFTGQTLAELMAAITRGKVRVPKQHRPVPGWIHEVVVRGLHVDADRRWPDMPTLLEALGRDPARRRRRVALRVGAALLLGATVFAVLKARELQAQVCSGAAAQLGDVWSEARADEVRAALRASGLPYAPAAAERVVASLDDYADEWIAARTRACEATAVRQEQSQELLDRRMACLDERRAGLRALVGVLVAADAAVVEKAVQVTSELPRLEPCSDSAYLQARVRPPDDPAAALRVEATRAQLSQARTLMLAGKFAGAGRLVEEALAAAATLGYGPLVAEVELMHGELRTHEGSYTDAEAALRRAYVAARTAGDGEVAAAAATALVGVTGHSLARFEAGALWREVAAAEVARSGDPLAPADLARETASMAVREGDYVRAQAAYLRGLALREAVVGAEHSSLIGELNQLGAVLEKQGKYAEAASTSVARWRCARRRWARSTRWWRRRRTTSGRSSRPRGATRTRWPSTCAGCRSASDCSGRSTCRSPTRSTASASSRRAWAARARPRRTSGARYRSASSTSARTTRRSRCPTPTSGRSSTSTAMTTGPCCTCAGRSRSRRRCSRPTTRRRCSCWPTSAWSRARAGPPGRRPSTTSAARCGWSSAAADPST
jgi:tRNA A-37 threonylcarbamoyl transferase component Bud32/tetratricopeptide (TPR) repeat protein